MLFTVLAGCFSAHGTEFSVVSEVLPPLNYQEQGVIKGYSSELLEAVLQSAKLTAPIQVLPWARAYKMALEQPNTLIFSIVRTPPRENLFNWIGPICSRQIVMYKLRYRKDIVVSTLSDAGRYRVGVVRDMAATQKLLDDKIIPYQSFDFAPTTESNIGKLFLGRVDLMVALDWNAAWYIKKLQYKGDALEPVLVLERSDDFYFGMNHQSDPELISRIKVALEKVRASGRMAELKKQYLE